MKTEKNRSAEKTEMEAEKAKKFVEFYYFWKFHYCVRNFWIEIDKVLTGGKKAAKLPSFHKVKILERIYTSHPLSRMQPAFPPVGAIYGDIDELVFDDDGATFAVPHHIIDILLSGRELDKSFVSDDQHSGMTILGTNGISISGDGKLRGKIIAEIDLSSPLDSITLEISRLKKAKFKKVSEVFDFVPELDIYGDYQILADIIRKATHSSFSANDDPARAIGLWFWDMLSGPDSIFVNFAELWALITTGQNEKFYIADLDDEMFQSIVEKMLNRDDCDEYVNNHPPRQIFSDKAFFRRAVFLDDTEKSRIILTPQVFVKLGYAVSDPSVFRRLYRNTAKCIEACEVLSLK